MQELIKRFQDLDNFDNSKELKADFFSVCFELAERLQTNSSLNAKELKVLQMLGQKKPVIEIAESLNLSRSRIYSIQHKAKRKIRRIISII